MTVHATAPDVQVFLDGVLSPHVQVLDVQLGAGGAHLPQATLEFQKPGRQPKPKLENVKLCQFPQPEVEIVIAGNVVHWGKVLAQPATLDGRAGDQVQWVSRMDEHHFGEPLHQAVFYEPFGKKPARYALPLIFNPEWDGKISENMSSHEDKQKKFRLLSHPGSLETQLARDYHGTNALAWNLVQAVFTLCWVLNPEEQHVKNPSRSELQQILSEDDGLVRNHECRRGGWLPEQLDELLAPLGYGWTIQYEGRGRRRIRVYSRAEGRKRQLKHQKPGARLDLGKTNLEGLRLVADVAGKACNAVRIVGAPIVVEGTFYLKPAWDPLLDELLPDQLTKNDDGWFDNPAYADVWRKWVLNEAGDYCGPPTNYDDPHDFSVLFFDPDKDDPNDEKPPALARRRQFEACLTLQPDGSPQGHAGGVFIEFFDNDQQEWVPLDRIGPEGRQVRILEKECGIYFDGLTIPTEIRAQASLGEVRVRVTASVETDERAEVLEKADADKSLLKEPKELTLDLGGSFKRRRRDITSRFEGLIEKTSEIDDTKRMKELAKRVLEASNVASLAGTVTITGIDFDVSQVIGTTLQGIDGRNVDFNVSPVGQRYPTVVGCHLNVANQQLELVLENYYKGLAR